MLVQDTYSLGILMYELYTGMNAFKKGTFAAHCRRLTSFQRPEFPPETQESFRHLAEKCWDHNPQNRPSNDKILLTLNELAKTHRESSCGTDEKMQRSCFSHPTFSLNEEITAAYAGYLIPEEEQEVDTLL